MVFRPENSVPPPQNPACHQRAAGRGELWCTTNTFHGLWVSGHTRSEVASLSVFVWQHETQPFRWFELRVRIAAGLRSLVRLCLVHCTLKGGFKTQKGGFKRWEGGFKTKGGFKTRMGGVSKDGGAVSK